jgi:hypothetical protein
MKVFLIILTLSLFAPGLQNPSKREPAKRFDFTSQVAIASLSPSEQLCLNAKNSNLAVGEALTLISLDNPQSLFRAKIIERLDWACSEWDVSGEDKNYYRLEVLNGKIDSTIPLVAILKSEAKFLVNQTGVEVDLNQDGVPETFRSCVSSEGLHLTIWSGNPLVGKRQWHIYYYLGYDMEGDCTRKEIQEQ